VVALGLLACNRPIEPREPLTPGWPQIVIVNASGGDGSTWVYVDEKGTYLRINSQRVSYDVAPTTEECRGTVPSQQVAPWFEKVRKVALTPDQDRSSDVRADIPPQEVSGRRHPSLRYYVGDEQELHPSTAEAFHQLRALAIELDQQLPRGKEEECKIKPGG
jgi:hypothetical protein